MTTTLLACVAGAIPVAVRDEHFALAARLFGRDALERRAAANGYAYRFDGDRLGDLARWIEHERRCCPFLSFRLDMSEAELWLHLDGPDGTRAFLDAELSFTHSR